MLHFLPEKSPASLQLYVLALSQAVVISVLGNENIYVCLLDEQPLPSCTQAHPNSTQNMMVAAKIRLLLQRRQNDSVFTVKLLCFLRQFRSLCFTALETVLTIKLTCWYIFFLVKALFYEAMSCSHMLLRCHNISQSSKYSAVDNRYSETSQLGQNFSSYLQKWLCE